MSTGVEPWKGFQATNYERDRMKREMQKVEFWQYWHDGCLKWICGFAIAQGGKLVKITACVADELEWRLK